MRLADDEVMISLGSQAFTLRVSLRAAFLLNLKYDGFHKLSEAINQGTISAYLDVIKAGCGEPAALNVYLKPFHDPDAFLTPLRNLILGCREELLAFVRLLAGWQEDDEAAPQKGKPISFEEYHTTLFRLGTGWLGWTPEDTWEATPAEIIEAVAGRRDMLAAIFGKGGEGDDSNDITKMDKDARKQLWAKLGVK